LILCPLFKLIVVIQSGGHNEDYSTRQSENEQKRKGGGRDEKDGFCRFSYGNVISNWEPGLCFGTKATDNREKSKSGISKSTDFIIKKGDKMKKAIYTLIAVTILLASQSTAFAHSGRTDSYGGHWNRADYGVPVYEYHN
jgi:hypothetical protein